jgi:hypothetical protein
VNAPELGPRMEYSFPRYLLAKQTIDDRALNRNVVDALKEHLPSPPLRVIEVGAGMGNMLARLLTWGLITRAEYVHEDALIENIRFASTWIPEWAAGTGMRTEAVAAHHLRIFDDVREIQLHLESADVADFISRAPAPGDLLIAHAFLDLLRMPESLGKLLSLTRKLAWLTINFDGLTSLQPTIDADLDDQIEQLYHKSMDTRLTGGDSRVGRHLFTHLAAVGAKVLAAGSSDWVVFAQDGKYPADEAYFLHFILHFFEESLTGNPDLDAEAFAGWLAVRHSQVERGELVYIAHQLDFLVQV